MDLGRLISRLEGEQNAGDALTAIGDLVLYAEISATGARFGESPACYTAGAVGRFAGGASAADWVTVLGAMEQATQPSQAFLLHAIRWALTRDGSCDQAAQSFGSCATGESREPCHDESS